MRSNYKKLGEYIRSVDERNSDGSLGEDNLYGISVTKDFIVTHANLVGVTFDSYKVVGPRQFAYIPDTSRRGDKIAISLNTTGEKIIVSSICTVFEIIDEDQLLPEFLMLWLCARSLTVTLVSCRMAAPGKSSIGTVCAE